jgi:hypothetical protein
MSRIPIIVLGVCSLVALLFLTRQAEAGSSAPNARGAELAALAYARALGSGDYAAACNLLSAPAARQIVFAAGRYGHGGCAGTLETLTRRSAAVRSAFAMLARARVESATLSGSLARVKLVVAGRPLMLGVVYQGRWQVAASLSPGLGA